MLKQEHQDNMSMKSIALEPQFYIVKRGFIGLKCIQFLLVLIQNIDCGYWLEPPQLIEFLQLKKSLYIAYRQVFVMRV